MIRTTARSWRNVVSRFFPVGCRFVTSIGVVWALSRHYGLLKKLIVLVFHTYLCLNGSVYSALVMKVPAVI